jgi:hypothetical protein
MNLRHYFSKNSFLASLLLGGLIALSSSCKVLDPAATLPLVQAPKASSYVNVPIEIPNSTLTRLINQTIPPILFNDPSMDLGNGIQGDLEFLRNGEIRLMSLDSQRLEVTFPLSIRGEVGLKPGGLRNLLQGKIPINQSLSPVFVVNPQIQPNWNLEIREFELLDLGGKIGISALGMQIDLSSMIRNEIRSFISKNLTSNPDLIRLKPLVESVWNQVGMPVFVDLAGKKIAFSIQPETIKLREYATPQKGYHLDLGLSGQIQTHPASAAPSRPFPLPKISENRDQTNSLEINIPLYLSYQELDAMIQESFEGQVIRMNKKYFFRPSNFKTKAYGERMGIAMDFQAIEANGNMLSGELFLAGLPVFDSQSKELVFEKLDFHLKSESSKARLAAKIKRNQVIRQVTKRMRFSLEDVLEESLKGINERISIQTPYADLKLKGLEVYPDGFFPTISGMDIRVKARGQVSVEWK